MTDNRIDFTAIFLKLWNKKFLFLKTWIIVFIVSCLWIFPQPRYYNCSVSLAPESSDGNSGGGLASLAANFGLSLGSMASSDAIHPQLYPDIFESTDFIVDLFDIRITTSDHSISTDYYTYITEYKKENPYKLPFKWVKEKIFNKDEEGTPSYKDGKRFNPFMLNKKTNAVKKYVSEKVTCSYSKASNVITINVEDQDPLVCALLADSVMKHLQDFIVTYRTKKAKNDYDYYQNLTFKAKAEYDSARIAYSSFVDRHSNLHLSSHQTKQLALESEMNIKQQMYNVMSARMEESRAKIQENTPVFTTLKCATVPILPAGPKRSIFCLAMLVVSTLVLSGYILRKEIMEWF